MAVKATANITLTRVDDGAAGKGIKSTSITYQAGTSGTAAPTGAWSTNVPSVPQGQYLWSKTVITYTDDTTSTTYSVAYIPKNGTTGATGATGTGIQSITQEYYLSTSKTSQTGGSWVTSMPTWSSGKYLWTRYKITYENPTSTAYTSPICDSSWEAVNDIQIGGRNLIKNGRGNVKAGFFTNFETVTEDYGEHTLTSKGNYPSISLIGSFIVNPRDYEPGRILTWSFDIMYTKWDFPEGTRANEWWMGQRYSMQAIEGGSTQGQWTTITRVNLPQVGVAGYELNKWHHVKHTLIIPEPAAEGIGAQEQILLYNPSSEAEASITFRLKNVKLEYGNKATDWTPAPEDMATNEDLQDTDNTANDALGKVESTEDRVTITESELQILKDSISTMVTDENGTSLMTQKGDGWTFNMGSINKALDNTASALNNAVNDINDTASLVSSVKDVVDSIEKKTAYITMSTDDTGTPCIELGKADNPFKLRITNTSVDFLENGTKIAYVSNQTLYIERAIIKNELQIGDGSGFIWRKRENGNLGLRWTGG